MESPTEMETLLKNMSSSSRDRLEKRTSTRQPLHSSASSYEPFHPSQIFQDPDTLSDGLDEHDQALLNEPYPDRAYEAAHGRGRLSLPQPGQELFSEASTSLRQPARSLFTGGTSRHADLSVDIQTPVQQPRARQPLRPLPQLQTPVRQQRETESSSPFFGQSSPTPSRPQQSERLNHVYREQQAHPISPLPLPPPPPPPLYSDREARLSASSSAVPSRHQTAGRVTTAPPRVQTPMPSAQGISLVPVSELPGSFANVFPYSLFNAVQSKCYPHIMGGDDNFVMSAPTGSGKTVILELAVARLITSLERDKFKVVYMAPTRALCSERQKDWSEKFRVFNMQCAELTGDTASADAIDIIEKSSIIIATPEKWDSTTRKWKEHKSCMERVKLLLIDEVHMLKDSRGATLEAVVSRMKTVGSGVRFVALSATIPNASDVASWLGKGPEETENPAHLEVFDDGFRPVKLEKAVYGFNCEGSISDWQFDDRCTAGLPSILNKHSKGHPILVFCPTRASCVKTAKLLQQKRSSDPRAQRWWTIPRRSLASADSDLNELLAFGIAYHHAGLSTHDRTLVEQGFLNGDISVICCTSTLATGVNTPCHLVIVKGTKTYADNGLRDYSDLDIIQMMGRAGRPQYSHQGAVAVIMTSRSNIEKYERLTSGNEPLESCLHFNLIEHLNAEISLGTISDAATAERWLASTFLFVRLGQNPDHYRIAGDKINGNLAISQHLSRTQRLTRMCRRETETLANNELISGESSFESTAFGDAMTRYCVRFRSMVTLLKVPSRAKWSEILSRIVEADEFKDIRLQKNELTLYKTLNAMPGIRFPLSQVITGSHKCSLIIQAELGSVELPDQTSKQGRSHYAQAKNIIFRDIHRLIRCVIDCKISLRDAEAVRHGLDVARSFGAHLWDDSRDQLRQLPEIGPVTCRKLTSADITTISDLSNADPARINMILGSSGKGEKFVSMARSFPLPIVTVKMVGYSTPEEGSGPVANIKVQLGFMSDNAPVSFQRTMVYVCLLVERSDGYLVDFRRSKAPRSTEPILLACELTAPDQRLICRVSCDEFAGTSQSVELIPNIPKKLFPGPLEATNGGVVPQKANVYTVGMSMNTAKKVSRKLSAGNKNPPLQRDVEMSGLDEFDDLDESDLLAAEKQTDFRTLDEIESSTDASSQQPLSPQHARA